MALLPSLSMLGAGVCLAGGGPPQGGAAARPPRVRQDCAGARHSPRVPGKTTRQNITSFVLASLAGQMFDPL